MGGLALVAALAAQAVTQTGAAPPTSAPVPVDTTGPSAAAKTGRSTYVEFEAGAGYSSNPQLSTNSSSAAFARVSARAVHTRVSDRATTVLSAFGQSEFYARRYGSAQSFSFYGRHDAAVSEKLRVYVDGNAAYDRGGQLDTRILGVPDVPLLLGTTVPPQLLTPGGDFLTVTGRSYRAGAHAGAQLALGPLDSVSLMSGIDHNVFKTGALVTRYTTVPISVGYSRAINARANIGVAVVAQSSHYSGDIVNGARNFSVVTPELTGGLKLSERVAFSGDIGASFSSVDDGIRKRHSTGLTADANLCSTDERTQYCARASIQQQAATSLGPSRVISVGIDYSRRLSADDTLQFSFSGNRYANPVILLATPVSSHATYVRAAADYSRRIGTRLFGGVSFAARKVTQSGPDTKADISASVFLRYRLGDLR